MGEFTNALGGVAKKIVEGRQKKPRLFYYEEGCNAYIPVPEKIENMIDVMHFLDDGDVQEIEFKRVDLTDEEFANLPEAS
jgi:hypothetical protein